MALLRLYRLTVLSVDVPLNREKIRALPDDAVAQQWARGVLQQSNTVAVRVERSEEGQWVQVWTDAH